MAAAVHQPHNGLVNGDGVRDEGPAPHAEPYDYSVGTSIPANMAHAVSVSLPKWQDNVDYEEGRLTEVMKTGYPRFFVHRSIQKLAAVLLRKFGTPGGILGHEPESCYLFPSSRIADRCRSFIRAQHAKQNPEAQPLQIRVVQFSLVLPSSSMSDSMELSLAAAPVQLYIVLFPTSASPLAKSYWQHTGDGISSRLADHCLSILEETGRLGGEDSSTAAPASAAPTSSAAAPNGELNAEPVHRRYSKNRHYSRTNTASGTSAPVGATTSAIPSATTPFTALRSVQDNADADFDFMAADQATYVEERYGRNLPADSAPLAKKALRRRIAGTLLSDRDASDSAAPGTVHDEAGNDVFQPAQRTKDTKAEVGPTARQGTELKEDDVFLFPSGMSSIFHAHQTAMKWRRAQAGERAVGKSVCFGFPYTDTLKILQKWGPGCHFFGRGDESELDQLESILRNQAANGDAPILSLFCEFPSNPLLRCPDLPRIRRLADEYDFVVVVDETIGNFLNVEVLPYADIVVSSLTKVFSGDCNVMGGSMVVNPRGRHCAQLRNVLIEGGEYEDTYWGVDAVFMERNSRDFAKRVDKIDRNAEALASMLREEMLSGRSGVVEGVYYPKFVTRDNYEVCRRKQALPYVSGPQAMTKGGYGGLFSIIFNSLAASKVFYDALKCAKGPSLGTNFTLASPYTLLAHYTELDWAKEFGVQASLVRVSTGLEETEDLLQMFKAALQKAGQAGVEAGA